MNFSETEVLATVKGDRVTISASEEHKLINGLTFNLRDWMPDLEEGLYLAVAQYRVTPEEGFQLNMANDPIPVP